MPGAVLDAIACSSPFALLLRCLILHHLGSFPLRTRRLPLPPLQQRLCLHQLRRHTAHQILVAPLRSAAVSDDAFWPELGW